MPRSMFVYHGNSMLDSLRKRVLVARLNLLALVWTARRKNARVFEIYDHLQQLNPDDFYYWDMPARIHRYGTGDHQAAIELWKKAYELSSHPTFLYEIGMCYSCMGSQEIANDYLNRFLDDPDDRKSDVHIEDANRMLADS